jgi:23S rRNA-/tRNA-specific pseudouridylate synthase
MDGEFTHTVENFVKQVVHARGLADQGEKVRKVHRLDYATSGVVLMALTKHAAGIASDQFERRAVEKKYIALLHGHLPDSDDSSPIAWKWNIAPTAGFSMQPGTVENPGRSARTVVSILERGTYFDTPVTKVLFSPESGRRHQLRVHSATAGYPIVGDATYIEDECVYFPDQPGFIPPRMMLHAGRLEIEIPPAAATVYGRKSGSRIATRRVFEARDPFENMAGLSLGRPNPWVENGKPSAGAAERNKIRIESSSEEGTAGWCVIQ